MPWWVASGGMGLCLVLAGSRFFVVGRRAASRHSRADVPVAEPSTPDRDRAMNGALFMVLGLLLSGFGFVVLAVTAMLVRAVG